PSLRLRASDRTDGDVAGRASIRPARVDEGGRVVNATGQPVQSLQGLIDSVPNIVDHLYQNPKGVLRAIFHSFPPSELPPEFTNWRDEQRARRETVALL